jgi:exopolysaccharide production protein ExoQ
LPLVFIWLALFTIEHSMEYASIEYAESKDGKEAALDAQGSSAARQAGVVALGVMGVLFLVTPSRASPSPNRVLMFAIVGLGTLLSFSALWADDPVLSLKRAAQPILLMVAALGVAKHWQPRDVCRFAAFFTGTTVLVGFLVACASGSFLYGEAYRFSGTLHPNAQAVNCAVLALASIALCCDRHDVGRFQWWWLLLAILGLVFLLVTRSRTTTVSVALALMAFFFIGASWPRKIVIASIPAMGAVLCAILLLAPDSSGDGLLLDAVRMGRGDEDLSSLTGRIPIWQAVVSDIGNHPLLGYGYGSFWTAQRVWEYSFIRHWEFNHAHSAYFETLLNVGIVGLLLGLFLVVWTGWSAVARYAATRDVGDRFIASIIVLALVNGLVDSNFVIVGFAPLIVMLCVSMIALHGRVEPAAELVLRDDRQLQPAFRTALNY